MPTTPVGSSNRKPLLAKNPFRGPHPGVTVPYLVVGEAAFLLALVLAAWRAPDLLDFYYQGPVLAITHLLTLGWITMTIMGASFLVVPMIFLIPLFSERLGRAQFAFMLAGLVAMVVSFWAGRWEGVAAGAGLILLAAVLYLVNMAMTLRRMERRDVGAEYIAAAFLYLGATVVLGNAMALDKLFDFLGGDVLATIDAHTHLAALGWATMMIVGVAHKMIPLLHVGDPAEVRRSRIRFWLLNGGLWGLIAALLGRSRWAGVFALLVAVGFGLVLARLSRGARQGRKRAIDWPTRFALTSFGFLGVAVFVGLALALGMIEEEATAARAAFTYGFIGLVGWISLMIVGMSFRVTPLVVWMHQYAPRRQQGEPVPPVNSLSSAKRQAISYSLCVPGILLGAAGLFLQSVPVLRTGLVLLILGFLVFETDMLSVYRHLWRAMSAPVASPAS